MPPLPLPTRPVFKEYPVSRDSAARIISALEHARPQSSDDLIGLHRTLLLYFGDELPYGEVLVIEAKGNMVTADMSFRKDFGEGVVLSLIVPGLDDVLQGILRQENTLRSSRVKN